MTEAHHWQTVALPECLGIPVDRGSRSDGTGMLFEFTLSFKPAWPASCCLDISSESESESDCPGPQWHFDVRFIATMPTGNLNGIPI